MEKTYSEETTKITTKKKGLSFSSVTSFKIKNEILSFINNIILTHNNDPVTIELIPTETTPNLSFWVNEEDRTYGLTITSTIKTEKWGWKISLDFDKWVPCAYMKNWGMQQVEIEGEDSKFLNNILSDHCTKNVFISAIIKEGII